MAWDDLEALMKELLMLDKAMTIPGSGNGKGEEDVIGLSTITQCKYSDKKNMSILRKDMDRLKDAAELQKKIPLFITEHDSELLLTIPNSLIFQDVLYFIISASIIRHVQASIQNVQNIPSDIKKEYISLIYKRALPILNKVNDKYQNLAIDLKTELEDPIRDLQYILNLEENE